MPAELAEVVATPFTAWVAPAGTAREKLSTKENAFSSAWTMIGHGASGKEKGDLNYSEAGVTVTHTQGVSQFVSAGGITPRKSWRTEEGMQVAFDLVDLSPEQYALIMDQRKLETRTTETPHVKWFEMKRGIKISFYALILRGVSTLNENTECQYYIPAAYQASNPAPKFALKGGPAMLALQFDVLELVGNEWAYFEAQE